MGDWLDRLMFGMLVTGLIAFVFAVSRPEPPKPVVPYSGFIITQCDLPLAAVVTYSNGAYEVSRPTDSLAAVEGFIEVFKLVPKERRTEQKIVSIAPCGEPF